MTKWSAWKRWPATLLTEWYNNLTLSVRLIIVCIRNQTNKQTNEHNRICLHFYMRQTLSISIHKVIRHFSEHHTMHCRFVWLPFSEKRRRRRRRSRRHACTRFTCTRIVYITHAMCRRHSECTWIMNEWKNVQCVLSLCHSDAINCYYCVCLPLAMFILEIVYILFGVWLDTVVVQVIIASTKWPSLRAGWSSACRRVGVNERWHRMAPMTIQI